MNKEKKWLVGLGLVLALAAVRWVDCKLMWELGRWEYRTIPEFSGLTADEYNSGDTVFLGFSSRKRALEVLKRELAATEKDVVVVSYYNLIYPSVYLCANKSAEPTPTIFLPWEEVKLGGKESAGFYFLKCDRMIAKRSDKREVIKTMVMGSLLLPMIEYKEAGKLGQFKLPESIYYPMMSSKILKKIYIFYFYFPLAAILILGFAYSKKVLISLYYFVIAPFVFWPVYFLLSGPLLWKNLLLNNFPWGAWQAFVFWGYMIAMYVIIIKFLRKGRKLRKQEPLTFTEKAMIWFFFLFLVVVRF